MQSNTIEIEIPLLLPEIPGEEDACVDRLVNTLRGRSGVSRAHVKKNVQGAKELCIHFDPRILSLSQVEECARRAGADPTKRFGHAFFETKPLRKARQASRLQRQIEGTPGVLAASVAASGFIRVEYDRDRIDKGGVEAAVSKAGIPLKERFREAAAELESSGQRGPGHPDAHKLFGERTELFFAIGAGLCLALGYASSRAAIGPSYLPLALYIGAYFFGGFFACIEAVENLLAKRFEIDSLMIVAAIGAAALGQWLEGALLLALFSIGHSLEHFAMGRAKKAIEALAELAPRSAHLLKAGGTSEVAVDELKVGDLVQIKPNERIPVDGVILKGSSAVNQAPVTGESVPVDKTAALDWRPGQENASKLSPSNGVFAGTINGSGLLEVTVTKISSESALARVVKMVAEAQAAASPTQQLTERLERYFVPAVFVFVVLLLFVCVVVDEPFSASFYRAMAVLVASSPCALAISTPSAVLSGIARAGRSGVLIKSGAALENLGRVKAIAFDKTGTLTEGKPKVTDILPEEKVDERELLEPAVAVESGSDHPLARAVLQGARDRLKIEKVPAASGIESLTGKGVKGSFGGKAVLIGKPQFFFDDQKQVSVSDQLRNGVQRLQENGRTVMMVAADNRMLGAIGIMDTPRASAKAALEALGQAGVKKTMMISGDNQKVADAVARAIGVSEAFGDLMPDDKVTTIKRLRDQHQDVAMVGDGVNDAPAMAAASVGIAMGAAGSEVALEAADVALMTDDLLQLGFAVGLSRKAAAIIKQNLWISLGMVGILIPATLSGLGIGPAVVMHEGSTLVVVFNALRLLGYKRES